ncbi:hypothetical protein V5O48_013221 [Marasmius crinis-equi]|uniref:F-box domain-containing protein n=1 Tax=Marasmius crinis-equi TaxID=585013 RepID=A0ABR3F0Q3_9AGAR
MEDLFETDLPQILLCSKCNDSFSSLPNASPVRPEQLRSGSIPTKLEQLRNLDVLKAEEHELIRYDQELQRLDGVMQNLRGQRHRLATRIQQRKSWMAPIRTLPPEILGEIFSSVCSAEGYSLSIGKKWDLKPAQVRTPALDLAQVSFHWRQVAIGHSRLWSSIEVDIWRPCEAFEGLIGTYLNNSAGAPLDVRLRDTSYRGGTMNREVYRYGHLKEGCFVFDWLLSHSPRITSLSLDGVNLAHALPEDTSHYTFPLLRRLECTSDLNQVDPGFMEKLDQAPLLDTVVAPSLHASFSSYKRLSTLTLTQKVSDPDIFGALARSFSLRSLSIRDYRGLQLPRFPSRDAGRLSLPCLQHLSIGTTGYPSDILPPSMELPELRDLELSYRAGAQDPADESTAMEDWPCPAYISIAQSCSYTLSRLSITFKDHIPSASAARQILQLSPSLTHLELHLRRDVAGFTASLLSALTIPDGPIEHSTEDVLVPKLTFIEVTFYRGEDLLNKEIGRALADMVVSRSIVGLQGKERLGGVSPLITAHFDFHVGGKMEQRRQPGRDRILPESALFWDRIQERGLLDLDHGVDVQ